MRSTLIADCTDCNAARCRFADQCSREQVTDTPERRHLNDGVRASYDISPGDTFEAVVCALILAPLSVALVAIGAIIRMASR
jgi:hypothetical protein